MSPRKTEEELILDRLDEIIHEDPDAPDAALAAALVMLNHKLDMVLSLLTSRPPA